MKATLLALLVLAPTAGAGPQAASKHARVDLVPEVESIQPGTPFTVALRIQLEAEWHTYWINPGDSGKPVAIRWTLPEGVTAGAIQWPYPEAIRVSSLTSYGHHGDVAFLVDLTPSAALKPGTTAELLADVSWLECAKVCLPAKATLDVRLPVRAEPAAPRASAQALFTAARGKHPADGTGWKPQLLASGGKLALAFEPATTEVRSAEYFPERAHVVKAAVPQTLLRTKSGYSLTLAPDEEPAHDGTIAGVLVVDSGRGAQAFRVESSVKAADALPAGTPVSPLPMAATSAPIGLVAALGLAFVGGLILNLMPCVLPVLSLKVLSFVRHAGVEGGRPWRHGVSFTVGVVVSFLLLAGALLVLRAGGEQIGWGFQLQSPRFVAGLGILFFLIGLNLFGVFEVGASLTRAGGLSGGRSGLAASFADGALATLVATPCTAPFMGSALGFGLAQPAYIALLIFAALGLGMATPYLILSMSPALLRFVPKPGAWMETFKQLMGFLMMGTVVVLVWIFGRQAGSDAVAFLLGGLVVIGLGAWIYGRAALASARARLVSFGLALACALAGVTLSLSHAEAMPLSESGPVEEGGIAWQPFSAEAVAAARASGKPVFIDFTAAWCLSCQVNERIALRHASVRERFQQDGIVAFKADWTLQDERITEALRGYGRSGVPLYVFYAPNAEARLLPEVITPDIVLNALDEAASNSPVS